MRFMLMDNPAKQLGYSSIEEMRIQEHEIIASDDSDNTVAEGIGILTETGTA